MGTLLTEGWTSANVEFQRGQSAVRALVQEMKLTLEATRTEGLLRAAAKIESIDVDREAEKVRLSTLLADISSRCEITAQTLFAKVGALEHSALAAVVTTMVPRPPARVLLVLVSPTHRNGS